MTVCHFKRLKKIPESKLVFSGNCGISEIGEILSSKARLVQYIISPASSDVLVDHVVFFWSNEWNVNWTPLNYC